MLLAAAFLSLVEAPPAPRAAPAEEVITVTATRRKCRLSIADRILSDREFKARAADWAAGTPLTVVFPPGASYKCMAKVLFRLSRHGVHTFRLLDEGEEETQ
jgi:hypothetical protein